MPWFLALLLGVVAGVLGLTWAFPGALSGEGERIQLAYGLTLLAVLGSSLVLGARANLGQTVRYAVIWAAILLGLVTVYSYQDGFAVLAGRTAEALVPEMPVSEAGAVKVRASLDGHFHVVAEANGERVRFLIDTGATLVVLTPDDARRAGFDIDRLAYVEPVSTANGTTHVARVRLKELSIGSITEQNVEAMVARGGLEKSLLGMSFLRRLDVAITKRELVMTPRA